MRKTGNHQTGISEGAAPEAGQRHRLPMGPRQALAGLREMLPGKPAVGCAPPPAVRPLRRNTAPPAMCFPMPGPESSVGSHKLLPVRVLKLWLEK